MKRIAIFSALALLLGAVTLRVLQHDAGYVLIAVAGKTIEMRFWFAVLAIAVTGLGVFFILRLMSRVLSAFSNGWSLALANKATRGARRTSSGFIQFIEGDWIGAQKSLLKAAKDVDKPLVHYLGAARSAYETGDFNQAETLIQKARKIAPDNNEAIALSQARMLLLSKKYNECLSVLHGVKSALPAHPVVLDLLRKSYLALEDWTSLATLLPALEKSACLSSADFDRLQVQVYGQLLREKQRETTALHSITSAAEKSEPEGPPTSHGVSSQSQLGLLDPLESLWQRIPKALKKHPEILAHYVWALQQTGRSADSEPFIRNALKKLWSEDLVTLYGLAESSDAKMQLRTAQTWLEQHRDSSVLHLALGRICLRCGLWGQAKDYFLDSLQIHASPIAYAELARLQSSMGEFELSKKSYEDGLLVATGALPTLPLPCL